MKGIQMNNDTIQDNVFASRFKNIAVVFRYVHVYLYLQKIKPDTIATKVQPNDTVINNLSDPLIELNLSYIFGTWLYPPEVSYPHLQLDLKLYGVRQ